MENHVQRSDVPRDHGHRAGVAKAAAIDLCCRLTGKSQREVGARFGLIYSAVTDGKLRIHCVDWNGANSRILGDGFAQWPWRDPATGIECVYASNTGSDKGEFVDRFQLDKPETRERIFTGRLANRFSLSADGTRAVGEFPWPAAGMFYPRTGQVDRKDYRPGCNTYIAPDNSYLVTIMAGSHDLVTLYKPDGSSRDVSVVPPGLKKKKDGGNGCMWNPCSTRAVARPSAET